MLPDKSLPLARWIRVTFAGWSIGVALMLLLIAITASIGLGSTRFSIGLGMGLGVGFSQRRFLDEYLGGKTGWLLGTALSFTAPFLVTDLVRPLWLDLRSSVALVVVLGGVLAGLVQWLLLRTRVGKAFWWIPASALGWSGAGATVALNEVLPKIPGVIGALIYIAVILCGGVILGATTGVVLQRLPRTA